MLLEMTWPVELLRQGSPVAWLADRWQGAERSQISGHPRTACLFLASRTARTHTCAHVSCMYARGQRSPAERGYVTLLFETRKERKKLNGGTSLSLMDCWPHWLLPHSAPTQYQADGRGKGTVRLPKNRSPSRGGRGPGADPPSEPLVVVNHFDVRVLLTDPSSQLRLQPAHV